MQITHEDATGWVIRSALERDGFVSIEAFATWWIGEDDAAKVDEFCKAKFPGTQLLERRGHQASYQIMELGALKLGSLFETVEAVKDDLKISEYSISGTSLEQIFVSFAQTQREESGNVRGLQRL